MDFYDMFYISYDINKKKQVFSYVLFVLKHNF